MNEEHDITQPKQDENAIRDFERLLKSSTPLPVEIDTSVFDTQVETSASDLSVAQLRQTHWSVATASWFVGLATGLLVAILSGGAFQTAPAVQSTVMEDAATGQSSKPIQRDEIAAKRPSDATALAPVMPTPPPDYIEAFSPNNPNLVHSMNYASRGLLVSLSATEDSRVSVDSGEARPDTPFAPSQSTSVGSLRKQLPL